MPVAWCTMEIAQEVSEVVNLTGNHHGDKPDAEPSANAQVETTVSVQGGETVALGGLITDTSREHLVGSAVSLSPAFHRLAVRREE